MKTGSIPTMELVVGFNTDDTALLERLTSQFGRAVAELRRYDPRFGITLKAKGMALRVTVTAPTAEQAKVLCNKVELQLADVSEPIKKKAAPHREYGEAREMILDALGAQPGRRVTRRKLSEELGLPYTSVRSNITRLKELGLVEEVGVTLSGKGSGRPSKLYRLVTEDPQA